MTLSAPALSDRSRSVRVYLPPSYDLPEASTRRYPVGFLLHGWPGAEGDWADGGHAADTLDSLIADGGIPEVIAVMPDGQGRGLLMRSLYVNSHDGEFRMEDFIAHDLVAWVDSTFRTLTEPRDRALIGLSDGGSAAVNLAFKHPDVFGACGSHSGTFRLAHGFGKGRILGPDPEAAEMVRANSPLGYVGSVADSIRGMPIYFDCGAKDGDVGQNREMDRRLTELGIPHIYREFSGGHNWTYWRSHLHESLRVVTSKMWP